MSKQAVSPRPLNGYSLTSQFRKLRARWAFTHLEAHLFLELVAICTEEDWSTEFSVRNNVLTAALSCSEKGLIKARKTLQAAGLLTYIEGQNRRPTAYRFCDLKGLPEVSDLQADQAPEGLPKVSIEISKHLPEGLPEVSDSEVKTSKHLPEGLPKDLPEVSPYKEQSKSKELLRKTSLRKSVSSLENNSPRGDTFATFWLAYDKKRDRFKCEKKWGALTLAEQAAALAHVPAYVAATPAKQFRKDPQTYLNGKCWLDEELPVARSQQPSVLPLTPATTSPSISPALNLAVVAERKQEDEAAFRAHLARHAVQADD